jgi:hypothetical protein
MATNLVSLVMQFLTPDMIGRIASALGLDRNLVQSAISAAVPSLLAGFSNTAAQPGGAQKLVDAAAQQTGTLENFAKMLGAGNESSSFAERGSQMLSSLLGSQDQNALAGAIGKFTGMSQGATGSLLGMLAPVVLGMIKQQGTARLDTGKVAGLLAGQKDNIAAAMPSGLSKMLAGTGLLDSLGDAARTATAATEDVARSSASTLRSVGGTAQRTAGAAMPTSNQWLYWLIPAAAAAALLIYFLARPVEQVAEQPVTQPATAGQAVTAGQAATAEQPATAAPPTTAAQPATAGQPATAAQPATAGQSLIVGDLNIGKQVSDSIASLRTTLASITDANSARAALPKLQEAAAQFDKVSSLSTQLSAEQRKLLAGTVSPSLPTLNQLLDKVLAIPGVAELLKPTIEALKAKLAVMTA